MARATQKKLQGGWANRPASRWRFLTLTALWFASSGFGKSRGKGTPECGFKGEGQKQDKSRASQVTPGRSQRPAVRAAFRAFTGQERNSGNCLESLAGVRFWRHFRAEKSPLASALPKSQPFQGIDTASVLTSRELLAEKDGISRLPQDMKASPKFLPVLDEATVFSAIDRCTLGDRTAQKLRCCKQKEDRSVHCWKGSELHQCLQRKGRCGLPEKMCLN